MTTPTPSRSAEPRTLLPGFEQPQEISDVLHAFPGDVRHLMPAYDEIPDRFRHGHTEWNQFISHWFFRGDPLTVWDLYQRTGSNTDSARALRHIATILKSFQPKHEHKEAAAAYLLSCWFDGIQKKPAAA